MPRKEENSVFVGRRPTMNYVMATMMILNKGVDCTVKARGRAISHAVDVCDNVSSIEIVLAPPK